MNSSETTQDIQFLATQFREKFKTVLMATTSENFDVDASYAPYILDSESRICIFVSALARHTKNLLQHPHVSLLWIEDEQSSSNLFARERLTLQCTSSTIARDDHEWELLLTLFEDHHGETVRLLKQLQDFQLFRFETIEGLYVRGFGKAYQLSGKDLKSTNRQA